MSLDGEDQPLIQRQDDPPQSRRSCLSLLRSPDVCAAVIACCTALSMGFSLGYSCPALLDKHLLVILPDVQEQTWFGSLVTIGAMVGGPIAAVMVEKCGRKSTLVFTGLPSAVGWFMILYAETVPILYAGRLICGVAMGMISLSAPLYISEVSTKDHRGTLGSGFQLFVTLGILIMYALGFLFGWNWLAVFSLGVALANVCLLMFIPETPQYLAACGLSTEAKSALRWLTGRSEDEVEEDYADLEDNVQSRSDSVSIGDFLSRPVLKPLCISCGLMFFQQFSGINAVIFYSSNIFKEAGFKENPIVPSVIVGAILVMFTVLSCAVSDLLGRRKLLCTSGLLMSASIFALGGYYFINDHYEVSHNWLSLGSLCVFVGAFSIGWGPIPWLAMGELFPARVRGVACGIATCLNWLCAFIVTKEFLPVADAVTDYATFFAFGVINFLGIVFVSVFLPETKGRSLDEVEQLFI